MLVLCFYLLVFIRAFYVLCQSPLVLPSKHHKSNKWILSYEFFLFFFLPTFFFFKDLNNKFNIWNYLACPLFKLEAVLSVLYKPVLAIAPMPVNVL